MQNSGLSRCCRDRAVDNVSTEYMIVSKISLKLGPTKVWDSGYDTPKSEVDSGVMVIFLQAELVEPVLKRLIHKNLQYAAKQGMAPGPTAYAILLYQRYLKK